MENLDNGHEELGREMVVVKLDEEGEELEEVTMNMWQEILWQPELGNYQLRWFEVKKKIITREKNEEKRAWQYKTSENFVLNLQVDVIIMRASLTEVHLESLRTAKYISSIYNGVVKEQKNILLEICYS